MQTDPALFSSNLVIDASGLRTIIERVSLRQLHGLSDGHLPVLDDLTATEALQAVTEPDGITWLYPWGVTLYGLLRSTDVTDDPRVMDFVDRHNRICGQYFVWLQELTRRFSDSAEALDFRQRTKLRFLLRVANSNDCGAMGNQMLEAVLRRPHLELAEHRQVLRYIADWILRRQHRLPDGTFIWRAEQTEGQTVGLGDVVWPDDLFMSCPFLMRWDRYAGVPGLVDDAARQIVRQAGLMQDADGLWAHGYFWTRQAPAPFKWGRANGWALLALVEVLDALPNHHEQRPKLLRSLALLVEGLKKCQAPDGRWRQILDHPDLWEETSCSAMFAYGIARAVNRDWIDRSNITTAWKAFHGVARQITSDGVIKGCCTGTDISLDRQYYVERPHPDDEPHGPGPVLLAATELLKIGKASPV